MSEHPIPSVVERTATGERASDVYSRLLADRIVFCGAPIDDELSNLVCAQLLHLASAGTDRDITLFINSPGGVMEGMFSIYDTMQFVKPDVATVCLGQAASAAAVLLAAGAPGKRYALPHSRILIHQPHGQVGQGQAVDIEIRAREFLRQRDLLEQLIARHTGQSLETVRADTDRDRIMGADEARDYGIVDEVIAGASRFGPFATTLARTASRNGSRPD